ncbi:MAG: response regulator [Thermoplasmata archaeon]|nr:response regulator [Thermoplasmata archaeon]
MRVLIVDSDPELLEELGGLLEANHHAVTLSPTVAEALRALDQTELDVMFTDLWMGRHSGIDLVVEAQKRWPRMVVVVLTGKGTIGSAVEAMKAGAFDYLLKPVNPPQVLRVLALIHDQLALIETRTPPRDPVDLARTLATGGGYDVLLISPPPPPEAITRVSHLPLDPEQPFHIREAVEDFAGPREKAAVVLAAIEELLARHRAEDVSKLLEEIRALLDGKGPLAVGYNPAKISATGALAVRASIVAADAHQTLESLSNPIRRLVLRRLVDGPCTFMQAMEAAQIDDTSKIAFHLRKLVESGLVSHTADEPYRLTARGEGAIGILGEIDHLDSEQGSGNRIFTFQRAPPERSAARQRSESAVRP